MSNNLSAYLDIDQKVNLIYNYLYDGSIKNCFKIEPININSISIDDIKIEKNNNIFKEVYNDFKNGNFQLVKFNEDKNTTIFKRFSEGFPVTFHITPYLKESNITNPLSKNNKDCLFSYVLSKLVLDEKTKNILLPIINFDIKFSDLDFILKSYPIIKTYKDQIDEDKVTDTFSVRVKAQIFNFNTLDKYLENSKFNVNYKSIIFQVLHTLAIIQMEYPDFIHGSLDTKHLVAEILDEKENRKYNLSNNFYEIKNQKTIVKFSFFENSESEKILKNSSSNKDKYYDVNTFFNSLNHEIKNKNINTEVKKFIKEILSKGKINKTAIELLQHEYFNEFKNYMEKKSSKGKYMKNILEKNYSKKSKERIFMTNLESDSKSLFGDQEEIIFKRNHISKKSNKKLSRKLKQDGGNDDSKSFNQKGGNMRITSAPYQKVKNNPYISNDARETFIKRKDEQPRSEDSEPAKKDFEKKPYDPSKKQYDPTNKPYDPSRKPYDPSRKPYDPSKKPHDTTKNNFENKPYYKPSNSETESSNYQNKNTYNESKYENKTNYYVEDKKESKSYDRKPNKYSEFIPYEIPSYNPFHAHVHQPYKHEMRTNVNMVKPVNISFSNPVGGSHMTINKVYEDMLPGDKFGFTLKSTFERKQLTNFIRNMILENGDGEEMSISSGTKKTLLSYIRLLEVNPYNIERNPYKTLSKGFLLYTSAYPIRHDLQRNQIEIAKLSMGINVRLYELSFGAEKCFNLGERVDCDNFDVWREIKYYEYVREDILKKKVSPNFVGLYLYTIDSTSRIDYDKLNMIKYGTYPKDMMKNEVLNQKKVNNLHELDPLQFLALNSYGINHKKFSTSDNLIDHTKISDRKVQETVKYLIKYRYVSGNNQNWLWTKEGIKFIASKGYFSFITTNAKQPFAGSKVKPEEIRILASLIGKQDLTLNTGKSLIALTESPNNNILNWASPVSDNYGTVQKMIETGYHTPETWKSILFQLVYACAVLQDKGIYFEKFSLENNVYIKDLFTNVEKRDHWVYKVDGLEFFVPNYGYLLMIDSNFADIMDNTNKLYLNKNIAPSSNDDDYPDYKIKSEKLFSNKNNNNDDNALKKRMFYSFKQMINKDNFNTNLRKIGGEVPDQSILDLLDKMYSSPEENIKDYLGKYFREFLNNRIGTYLTQEEMQIVSLIPNFNLNKGDLVVYQERYQEFKWAIYLENIQGNKRRILVDPKGMPIDVYGHSLFKLPEGEVIKQSYVNGINFDSNFTIETYNFNN